MLELTAEQLKDDPPVMYEYQGVYFCDKNVAKETLHLMPEWQARKDDVYVVTYPKAGEFILPLVSLWYKSLLL